jgi:hypothetical protein
VIVLTSGGSFLLIPFQGPVVSTGTLAWGANQNSHAVVCALQRLTLQRSIA